jgi:stress response protein YsnF
MRSVIALYQDQNLSRSAVDDLVEHGFEKERINVMPDGEGAPEDSMMRELDAHNVPHDNAERYLEGVRRGYSLILVETSDDRAEEASHILDRHTPIDLGAATESGGYVDVVEEEVKVGKRPVRRGGVRVHTHVSERPIDEDLTLREEHVHVERHPVDERLSPAEAEGAFKEETIEMEERGEEPVVAKEAHVVERVDLGKEVETRTEHVHEVERRKDVEIEALGDEDELRRDWRENYEAQGIDYDTYRHAYAMGHRSGGEQRHAEWSTAEPELQREWNTRHKDRGPWEKFRAAMRRGWDSARGA